MKLLFMALLLTISLCSCHKENKRARNIMESKKSLVNRWYGPNHFDRNPKSDENKSLNETDDKEATEIDAGKMYAPANENTNNEESAPVLPTAESKSSQDHSLESSIETYETTHLTETLPQQKENLNEQENL